MLPSQTQVHSVHAQQSQPDTGLWWKYSVYRRVLTKENGELTLTPWWLQVRVFIKKKKHIYW